MLYLSLLVVKVYSRMALSSHIFEDQMFDIFLCTTEITVATVVFIPFTNG